MKTLEAIFTKLDVQSLAYVGSRVPAGSSIEFEISHLSASHRVAADQTITMAHVTALRDSFVLLEYRSYQAMRCDRGVPDDQTVARKSILEDFQRWFQLFWLVLDTIFPEGNEPKPQYDQISKQCRLLHIRYLIMTMRLANQGPSREIVFDTFEDSFAEIIRHAEALLGASPPRLLFTMDMELIEPLYFAAMKCREPTKRARALNLLNSCTQEGIWDGPLMAAIARYAVCLEEALFETEFPSSQLHSTKDEYSSSVADRMWNHRRAVNAETCRVSSLALLSVDWKHRTAFVECGHAGGKVRTMCTAATLP
ncbi:hypothetical protein BCR34DRAFT_178678 [Clohesyomyces aquaticus]|uniref:Uncharacterized protein n=1 Tax=Clohesyomyces aquaticus TaxID=1231657 RepID=A0A1Y1ZYY8_9PLEO|nr:hypothetical protein BCR34DRAFT_178678 [Clohesyomyces aquaticus]